MRDPAGASPMEVMQHPRRGPCIRIDDATGEVVWHAPLADLNGEQFVATTQGAVRRRRKRTSNLACVPRRTEGDLPGQIGGSCTASLLLLPSPTPAYPVA